MFRFIKQISVSALMCFGNLLGVNSLECISLKNQECNVRPEIVETLIVMILYFILLLLR